MSKYSCEFKLKVVKYCVEEHHSNCETAKHFAIPSDTIVMEWVRKYKKHGVSGLIKNQIKYDGTFKINVVEYMHNNHLSLNETAIHFNIGDHNVVGRWERIYYEEGPQALCLERRGRSKKMNSKPRKKKLAESTEKNLIAEIQQLRMENAYLKKIKCLSSGKDKARESEKVIAVTELRQEFKLTAPLKFAKLPRSTYYYYLKQLNRQINILK